MSPVSGYRRFCRLTGRRAEQDIDELHFAPLKIDQQLATVAVIHQQHMRNIAQWLQENGITRATVAPDWMSIPCGFMAGDAQRVICRIDECQGWSAGRALAPVMFRAQLNEQEFTAFANRGRHCTGRAISIGLAQTQNA
ncbi:type II secretion system protein GspL [Escherichia coli]